MSQSQSDNTQVLTTERQGELDLQAECARASQFYLGRQWDGLTDLEKKHAILNACAHGFHMGYRAAEKRILGPVVGTTAEAKP